MSTDNMIVLSAFAVYLVIMIVIGFIYSKSTKNNEDYFLGGRNLGGWTAAISAQASDMSGWLLMGLPGSVYLAGTGEIWIAVGLLIGTILNWYLVSARLRKYTIVAGNSLTIPSFFQNRYRDKKGIIKIVSAVIIAIFFTVYTASAFSSGAKLFATLFSDGKAEGGNFDTVYIVGLCIAALVILIYTFMGGFKAVCTTDLIQGMLMLVAIMAVPILAYITLTYNTSFSDALVAKGVENPANFLNFMKNDDGSSVSAVSIISNLAWGLGYFGMPHILVRFMSIKKASMIKQSATVAIIWVVLTLGAAIFIAFLGRTFIFG
ncbi:MAG: sodium/proline symporter, partial [Ruminococcus sp.]|nr:sodium/proline symporter [Ruminococcus sp.]